MADTKDELGNSLASLYGEIVAVSTVILVLKNLLPEESRRLLDESLKKVSDGLASAVESLGDEPTQNMSVQDVRDMLKGYQQRTEWFTKS